MGSHVAHLPTMVIDSGFASSSVLTGFEDAASISIMAPASLTGTITVRIATESSGVTASSTWADLQSGGSDVTIGAGNSVTITPPTAHSLILVSGTTETARRYFQVTKRFNVGNG